MFAEEAVIFGYLTLIPDPMKRHAALLLIAVTATFTATAQWTTDLNANTVVRAAGGNDATTPIIAEGPDGSTYTCWFENTGSGYELRMQRLDDQGNRLWDDAGLVVSDHPQNSAIFRYDMKSDNDGNAIVAFQDERTGTLDVVAYKIAPDGSFLWGADGVELPTPDATGIAPSVAALSNGNTAVAWNTDSSPGHVAFQIVDPSGTLLLPEPTQLSAATRLSRPVPVATTDGGFVLQYVREGAMFMAPSTLMAQRFDAAGAAVWTAPVQVSTKTISAFYFPTPISDGQDGFYLAFNTSNPDNSFFTDVYAQRVRGNGSLWSNEGTRMDNSATTQKYTANSSTIARVNNTDGLLVPLQVTDGAQGQWGLSVQRIDTAGVRQLGDAAVSLLPVGGTYLLPGGIAATLNGAVIVYTSGDMAQAGINAMRVDLSGAAVWTPAERELCTASGDKDDLQITSMRSGQFVVEWKDDRSANGIYAQNIAGQDLPTGVHMLSAATGARLEANPATAPVLLLDGGFGPVQAIDVFDGQGKQVYGRGPASAQRVALPLEGLPPGLYSIRVSGADRAAVLRWMK